MENTPENARTMDQIEDSIRRRKVYGINDYIETPSKSQPNAESTNEASNRTRTKNTISEDVTNREIRRILKTDEFFEILDLGELATPEEIKETYQRLASEFHPEACQEQGANIAFKKLAQAYDCLGDEEKRRRYKKCCEEEPDHPERLYRRFYNDYYISAENTFKRSYGTASNQNRSERQSINRNSNNLINKQNMLTLFGILVIVALVIASCWFFSQSLAKNKLYSLTANLEYNVEKESKNLKMKYYIKSDIKSNLSEEGFKEIRFVTIY